MRSPAGPARFLRTQHLAATVVVALIAVAFITGFAWADKHVTLIVDNASSIVTTQKSSVSSLLASAGVAVQPGDLVSPSASAGLADGGVVVVRHAVPVTLELGGRKYRLLVLGRTVADALVMEGLDPTSGLHSVPDVDAPLRPEMTITATDVFYRVSDEQVTVPFNTVLQGDPKLPHDSRRVVRKGVAGSAVMVWRTLVTGGVAGARRLQVTRVLSPAVTAVIHVGTKQPFHQLIVASRSVGRSPRPAVKGRALSMEATAYTPWDAGCTGSIGWVAGRKAHYHIPAGWWIIAVDPRVIPLGTRVYVRGYGYAVAADTGGAIKGHRIDVCYWGAGLQSPTDHLEPGQKSAALAATDRWGRRYGIRVTVLGR